MSKRLSRGFTLIELLVVIAIIGILSSVVLASLNTARSKGADAAIRSNINNMRAQAELSYDANSQSYLNVCVDPNVTKALNSVQNIGSAAGATTIDITIAGAGANNKVTCHAAANGTGYAISAPLKSTANTWFCVDNSGLSTTTTLNTGLTANSVSCGN